MKKLFQKILEKLVKKAVKKSVEAVEGEVPVGRLEEGPLEVPAPDPDQHPHGYPHCTRCYLLHGYPLTVQGFRVQGSRVALGLGPHPFNSQLYNCL